jgi:hypothetical protein
LHKHAANWMSLASRFFPQPAPWRNLSRDLFEMQCRILRMRVAHHRLRWRPVKERSPDVLNMLRWRRDGKDRLLFFCSVRLGLFRWRRPSASRRWKMLSRVTAGRTSSTPTKVRSSPVRPLPASSPTTASPSAWMAKGLGETTCSSSGFGKASNTRTSICEPMKPSARREARLVDISTFTTGDDRIRALTTAPRIKPTSIFLRSARRPNPGRRSTYRRGIIVHIIGTGSPDAGLFLARVC